MSINATLLGEFIVISLLIITSLSYYLGKRKTHTPFITCMIGLFLSVIPPLGLIYLAFLAFKNDLPKEDTLK
ncbi:hypothetical protein [Pseudoalteromonas denitrificans]|jgi:hypothetical protein|uniref:Phospholipase_D-nuclease N-terminal n=1 Tax=Pseudoalteromonas denitrificans DSM 6059 TaxID=1123010 RepID=A0A1I1LE15_9GAMM|nr:hypothetical protein [Pseudoalteromonas denitrificans]SFC71259.1 hypothetical protein SAMN02745724_02334 [Pseudoalteromonas denitrificans DSM 6059]